MTDLLAPGTYFAGHRILRLLGVGGHGNVYEALTPPPEQARQAIKLVAAEANQLPKLEARLAVEGVILATIEHENVVRSYDAGVEGEQVWILLELVEGRSLQQRLIEMRGALPIDRVMRRLHRACEGVAAAHAVGVVHRDLKPSNILISDSDGVKVIDFGVAHLKGSGVKTTSEQRLGTALYMAPEQVRGADADPRMDVYAMGMLAYEALAGVHPIGSKARALADAKDPARRPQRMRAVADRLAEFLARSRAPQRKNARNALRSNDPALAPTTPMAPFSGPDRADDGEQPPHATPNDDRPALLPEIAARSRAACGRERADHRRPREHRVRAARHATLDGRDGCRARSHRAESCRQAGRSVEAGSTCLNGPRGHGVTVSV